MNQPLTVHGFSDPGAPGLSTLPGGAVVPGPPGWGGYFAGTYDWAGNWTPAQARGSGGMHVGGSRSADMLPSPPSYH